jgi:hypothetical protein
MQKDKQQAQLGIWGKQLLQQANNSRFNETRNMLGAASMPRTRLALVGTRIGSQGSAAFAAVHGFSPAHVD